MRMAGRLFPYSRRWFCIAAYGRRLWGVRKRRAVSRRCARRRFASKSSWAALRRRHASCEKPGLQSRGSLDSFSTNLGNLKSTLAGARETVRATEDQTNAYFASWDEQLRGMSEEMQKTGQKRQAEVMASFAALRADLAEVRDSLKPFVDALSEIEQYLRTDQTKAGLDTVSSRLRSTADQEHVIRRGLDKVTQQIDTIQKEALIEGALS